MNVKHKQRIFKKLCNILLQYDFQLLRKDS